MDPQGQETPLRERQLPAASPSTVEEREEQQQDSPIRAHHDSSQLALQLQQMMAQMQGMQQLLLNEQQARQQQAQKHSEAMQAMQNRSQKLEQAISQTIQQTNLPQASYNTPAATVEVEQPDDVTAAIIPDPATATVIMPNGLKLDLPEPFTGKKQDVNDWLDRMDLYFLTEVRLPAAQRVPRAVLLLRDAGSKWLHAMLRILGKSLEQLMQEGLREEIKKAFRLPDFEFAAKDRLAKVKHHSEVAGYTAAFYEAYYQCSDLSEQDAIQWYVKNLNPQVAAFVHTNFPSNLGAAVATASRYKSSYRGVANSATNDPTHRNPQLKPQDHKKGKHQAQPGDKQPMQGHGTTYKFQVNCNWCGKRDHKEPECHSKATGRPRQAPATANYTHGHHPFLPAQYAVYPPPPPPDVPICPPISGN